MKHQLLVALLSCEVRKPREIFHFYGTCKSTFGTNIYSEMLTMHDELVLIWSY